MVAVDARVRSHAEGLVESVVDRGLFHLVARIADPQDELPVHRVEVLGDAVRIDGLEARDPLEAEQKGSVAGVTHEGKVLV